MPFTHAVTVRFSQVDGAGILYFSRIFEMCHEAYEGLMAHHGTPLTPELSSSPWLLPLVHAEADYVAPCRLGDRLDIHVSIERVGTTSITVAFRVVGDDAVSRATVRHVHTTIDASTFSSRPLPDNLRAWAERVAGESE